MIPHMDALYNFAIRLANDPNDAEDRARHHRESLPLLASYERGTNAKLLFES